MKSKKKWWIFAGVAVPLLIVGFWAYLTYGPADRALSAKEAEAYEAYDITLPQGESSAFAYILSQCAETNEQSQIEEMVFHTYTPPGQPERRLPPVPGDSEGGASGGRGHPEPEHSLRRNRRGRSGPDLWGGRKPCSPGGVFPPTGYHGGIQIRHRPDPNPAPLPKSLGELIPCINPRRDTHE